MTTRVGTVRVSGLVVASLLTAGLGVAAASPSHAVDPSFPSATSTRWVAVSKSAVPVTDQAADFAPSHLDLTASGGALGPATGFVSADLRYLYVRMHVADPPGAGAGGYVVQLDTDGDAAGWERAIRYDVGADTIAVFGASGPNNGVNQGGTVLSSVPATGVNATSQAGADGGAHVVFAVARAALSAAGVDLAAPLRLVMGTSTDAGVALDAGGLLGQAKADVLGHGKFGLRPPSWQTLASDPVDIDSDADGVLDRDDNCPRVANPGQEDDDADVDNSLPQGTVGVPDGTEGLGNACDRTPRGYDLDEDGVGLMDDNCPERPGLTDDGCIARSATSVTLGYRSADKVFAGRVRAEYAVCVPRRDVTIFRSVSGPDRGLGTVRTDAVGRYRLAERARPGRYYALVATKLVWRVGARCYQKKSPDIRVS